jgi:hypothetical protein
MNKWIKLPNGDKQAQGERGDFLIWKVGAYWKSRYCSKDHTIQFYLRPRTTLREAKRQAENNKYWEDE